MSRLSEPFDAFRVTDAGQVTLVDSTAVQQVSLFDQPTTSGAGAVLGPPRPAARVSDPHTSHEAAQSMAGPGAGSQQARVLAVLDEFGRHGGTAAEIAARMCATGRPVQQSVIARRCTDLHDLGLIDTSPDPDGDGEPVTRRGTTGRRLLVWCLTDQGRAAAQEIAA